MKYRQGYGLYVDYDKQCRVLPYTKSVKDASAHVLDM